MPKTPLHPNKKPPRRQLLPSELHPQQIVSTETAAFVLDSTPDSVKVSRSSGELYGVPAPEHIKIGTKTIRYRVSTLLEWMAQFEETKSTAQHPAQ